MYGERLQRGINDRHRYTQRILRKENNMKRLAATNIGIESFR